MLKGAQNRGIQGLGFYGSNLMAQPQVWTRSLWGALQSKVTFLSFWRRACSMSLTDSKVVTDVRNLGARLRSGPYQPQHCEFNHASSVFNHRNRVCLQVAFWLFIGLSFQVLVIHCPCPQSPGQPLVLPNFHCQPNQAPEPEPVRIPDTHTKRGGRTSKPPQLSLRTFGKTEQW